MDSWIDDSGQKGTWWPEEIPRDGKVAAYRQLFELHGFELAASAEFEDGFVRVALYGHVDDAEFAHVAVQLPTGEWSASAGGITIFATHSWRRWRMQLMEVCR